MMLALGIIIGGFIATIMAVVERRKLERRWTQAWHQAVRLLRKDAVTQRHARDLEKTLAAFRSRWDQGPSLQLEFFWDEEQSPRLAPSDEAASGAIVTAKLPKAPTLTDIRHDPSHFVLSEQDRVLSE